MSAEGGDDAGNLKLCENDTEPVRLESCGPDRLGVLGAVVTPGGRLPRLSDRSGENEDTRGDGCVEERGLLIGAAGS